MFWNGPPPLEHAISASVRAGLLCVSVSSAWKTQLNEDAGDSFTAPSGKLDVSTTSAVLDGTLGGHDPCKAYLQQWLIPSHRHPHNLKVVSLNQRV